MAKDKKKGGLDYGLKLIEIPAPAPVESSVESAEAVCEAPVEAIEAQPEPTPAPAPIPAKPALQAILKESKRATLQQLWGKVDVGMLYPPFVIKVKALLKACAARGMDYYVISGTRTWREQDALYAQGRTKPGNIVTKAQGGQSNHNYGIAVDGCLDKDETRPGLQPDWDLKSYAVWAEEAKKLGLDAGFYWKFKDGPHVQLNLQRHNLSIKDLNTAYTRNGAGFAGVWGLLDKYNWD
jgi:D-alanyl-D-alanine dipeptidase